MTLILFIFTAGIIGVISLPILILFLIIRNCKNNKSESVADDRIDIKMQRHNEAQGYYRNQKNKQEENQSQNQEQDQTEEHTNTQGENESQNCDPVQEQDLSRYYAFIEWLKQLQKYNQNQSQNQSQKYEESKKPKEAHYCPYTPEEEPEVAIRDQKEIKAAQRAQKTTYTKAKSDFYKKYDDKNIYKCKSGDFVKSKDERTIADFLFENNIPFEYEVEYYIYNAKQLNLNFTRMYPDFFIKGPVNFQNKKIENVYMEYWGKTDDDYLKRKENKTKVYRRDKCTLINLFPEDTYDCESSLTEKLTQFIDGQINY